jgi:6-phosphogluconolactonase
MAKLELEALEIVETNEVPLAGATWIGAHLDKAIAERGCASLALAGGNTPRRVYEELSALALAWNRVDVFFGDERCVPPDHPDSNFRMAREALLDRVHARCVYRMQGEREDPEAAACDYAALLPDALDVVILGMGEDGHTASLIPAHDWSRPSGRKVIAVADFPKPPPLRLSITPDTIWAARSRLVLATGVGKALQVRRALQGDAQPALYPVHTVRDATWLIDRAAASLLDK